jgi:hypothetical protein
MAAGMIAVDDPRSFAPVEDEALGDQLTLGF